MALIVRSLEPPIDDVNGQIEAARDGAGHGAEPAVHVAYARIERVVEIEDDGGHGYRAPPLRASRDTAAAARNAPRPSISR